MIRLSSPNIKKDTREDFYDTRCLTVSFTLVSLKPPENMLALLFSGGSAILFIVFYCGYELRGTPNAVHNRVMCSDNMS